MVLLSYKGKYELVYSEAMAKTMECPRVIVDVTTVRQDHHLAVF